MNRPAEVSANAPKAPGQPSRVARRAWGALHGSMRDLFDDDPLIARLLIAFVALECAGIFWDLPGSYGWENDGAAPRDLFGGLANNLKPGHGHRYPLLHYLLLGLLASPVLLVDVVVALLGGTEIQATVVSTPSMTAIALLSKLTNLAMMCVALTALGRVFRNAFSVLAGRWAVLFGMLNLSVAYYGRVTNMDGPYLMWTALAIDRLVLLARSGHRVDYTWFAIFVAAGMATKDQAYASYVLTGPLYLVLLPLLSPGEFRAGPRHWPKLLRAIGVGGLGYALLSGALFNPSGFLTRLAALTGPSSQDWKSYESSPAGWWANISDILAQQSDFWWPWPVVGFAWLGVFLAVRGAPEAPMRGLSWRLLPLAAGISSTLAFALVVGRAEHRFVLPLGFWLSGYAGVAAALLLGAARTRVLSALAFGVVAALLGLGLSYNLELLVTQWSDPRRAVERHLAQLPNGARVETYGLGVYLPRFELGSGSHYSVTHIRGSRRPAAPYLPGMHTQVDSYARVAERGPDLLVIPEGFAERFVGQAGARKAMQVYLNEHGALEFFRAAADDRLPGYRRLAIGDVELPGWYRALGGRAIGVHGSTARPVWTFERER